jgi:carbonic anhydrase
MKTLIDGVKKFQTEVFAAKKDLFQRLALGQNPRALFITCSDSRIDPGMLTQTEPGELFILRNAGNIVPSYGSQIGGTTATIEYAIGVLDVKNVIVCGHTDCAVMKGVLDRSQAKDLPSLKEWLMQAEATRQIIRENYAHLKGDDLLVRTIQENVRVQLSHLQTHPLVVAKLRQKTIILHGWVYSILTGQVWAYDERREDFVSLSEVPINDPAPAPKRRK